MSGPDWEYLYGELLQSTADQKGMIDYLEERRAALEEENERLHDLACADWFRCPVPQLNEANDALKEEVERLRAVVEAARQVTPTLLYEKHNWRAIDVLTDALATLAALDEEVGGNGR